MENNNGVTAHLQGGNPEHIHTCTWYYSHIFNLVLIDCTTCIVPSISLFGLLQDLYNFFTKSYKCFKVYKCTGSILKLSSIGATRRRSKTDALCKIFDSYDTWKTSDADTKYTAVYKYVLLAFREISNSKDFSAEIRHKANTLHNKLL